MRDHSDDFDRIQNLAIKGAIVGLVATVVVYAGIAVCLVLGCMWLWRNM